MSYLLIAISGVTIIVITVSAYRKKFIFRPSNFETQSLISIILYFFNKGYTLDYKLTDKGIKAIKSGKLYLADQINVVDFHLFESSLNSQEKSAFYAIETDDGGKGTLVDDYYIDSQLAKYMDQLCAKQKPKAKSVKHEVQHQ